MNLHEDRGAFAQYVEATADFMGLSDACIVEKDYFVTLFLQNIVKKRPDMIFKGGTSLSKCHKIINRFSEDIDMNVHTEAAKLTEGQRKRLKRDVISVIEESGFKA
ncbi:MAG: nucleotidyl transferase AbiEii/AbiGii toxin family protein [Clostridiales bacterium]|nr:nucleotidyl transferase AbiEii/AbiGii toxin family protein [Clostridiales bacterium]